MESWHGTCLTIEKKVKKWVDKFIGWTVTHKAKKLLIQGIFGSSKRSINSLLIIGLVRVQPALCGIFKWLTSLALSACSLQSISLDRKRWLFLYTIVWSPQLLFNVIISPLWCCLKAGVCLCYLLILISKLSVVVSHARSTFKKQLLSNIIFFLKIWNLIFPLYFHLHSC